MKKGIALFLVLFMMSFSFSTPAALAGDKGASASGMEHASDQSVFNRIEDWFTTIGKSEEEAAKIKAENAARRAAKRAEKEAKKKAKEAEKAADKMKKKMSY